MAPQPQRVAVPDPTPVEVLSFPTALFPGASSEIRLRFSETISEARVIFNFNPLLFELSGRGFHDGEFRHQFIEGGSRELAYDVLAKEVGIYRSEEVDLIVYQGDRQVFARVFPIAVERPSLWRTHKRKAVAGLGATFAGLVGFTAKQLWPELAKLTEPAAFSRFSDFTDSAVKGWADESKWLVWGDAKPDRQPIEPNKAALALRGQATILLGPRAFNASWLARKAELGTFDVEFNFTLAKGDALSVLVHAEPDGKGGFRSGNLLQLRFETPLTVSFPGEKRFALENFELTPEGTRISKDMRSAKTGNGPGFQLSPQSDSYNFKCSQELLTMSCQVTVESAESRTKKGGLRESPQTDEFLAFSLDRLRGGTVGLQVEKGTEVYIWNWKVTSTHTAGTAAAPKE